MEARESYGSLLKFINGEVVDLRRYKDYFTIKVYCEDEFGRRIKQFNSRRGQIDVIRKRGEEEYESVCER